jgi:hypothetical protein
MVPVQLQQTGESELAQPGIEGDGTVAQVVREVAMGLDQRFLDDIGRIDAGGEPSVHPDGNHPAQPITVQAQKILPGLPITLACSLKQTVGIPGIRCLHRKHPPQD